MTKGSQDKKKLMIYGSIGGLLLFYSIYTNFLSGPSTPAPEHSTAAVKAPAGEAITMTGPAPKVAKRSKSIGRQRSDEFHPVYVATRPENRPDITKIDPTMRLDLLAKVQEVDAAGGRRNLFVFGPPPPPPGADALKGKVEPHIPTSAAQGVQPQPPSTNPADVPMQINLKYYGIVSLAQGGVKTACFLDPANNEEILLATEGEMLKRRYRVMKIGATAVIMQDTESKREQTLPLAPEAKGS